MFSARLPSQLTENAVSLAVAEARRSSRPLFDLTETNPTVVGLPYPNMIPSRMADPRGLIYQPSPFGSDAARQAVADTYTGVSRDRIVLTASTSEAYSLLFKLLCDGGDAVLVPRPSYPLFALLTRLDSIREAPYQLDPQGAWCIDRDSLEGALTPTTRAILVVSPNNPTGSMLQADDRDWLVATAQTRDMAIISDEVFADYPIAPRAGAVSLAGESRALTFTLGGLSKSAGLPQMKLAWIVVSGPEVAVTGALSRLAVIADSYLSVSTPVQWAAPGLIEGGALVRAAIQARLRRNLSTLGHAVRAAPSMTLFEPEGGWSVVLRVPAILAEEQLVLRLLADEGVLVHPGYFFDIEGGAFLVVSLLPDPLVFDEGVARMVRGISRLTHE